MTAKITLYSEDKLISDVKKFAKDKNTSVSKLVNGFFISLLSESKSDINSDSKITSSLCGVLKKSNIKEDDYKKHLEDKYL